MGTTRKRAALVIDANVLISSLIRYTGYTAKVLHYSNRLYDLYAPKALFTETKKHISLISKKSGLKEDDIELAIEIISKRIKVLDVSTDLLRDSRQYVNDTKDAQYVAVALTLLNSHRIVIILTYNKKDFKIKELAKKNIHVLTPVEFISWLRENVA